MNSFAGGVIFNTGGSIQTALMTNSFDIYIVSIIVDDTTYSVSINYAKKFASDPLLGLYNKVFDIGFYTNQVSVVTGFYFEPINSVYISFIYFLDVYSLSSTLAL